VPSVLKDTCIYILYIYIYIWRNNANGGLYYELFLHRDSCESYPMVLDYNKKLVLAISRVELKKRVVKPVGLKKRVVRPVGSFSRQKLLRIVPWFVGQ
jgi:hypothetical protein